MASTPSASPLRGCYVISLRPVGDHDAMRRAAATHDARVLALSPWRIERHDDSETRSALRDALSADAVLFTSPNAVRAAAALRALRPRRGQAWGAVGAGTAMALRRAGVDGVASPTHMDSEGLLDLPMLQHVHGRTVGLVSAPGGRGVIAATLAQRGARVLRADVYARVPIAPSASALARLRALRGAPWLALSSGEALQHVLASLPDDAKQRLLTARVLAASRRLADLAAAHGFGGIRVAADARPHSLLAAALQPAR